MFVVIKCDEFNSELIKELLETKVIKGCDVYVTEGEETKYKLYYHMENKIVNEERLEPIKNFFKEHIIPMEEKLKQKQFCIRRYYLDKDTGEVKCDY